MLIKRRRERARLCRLTILRQTVYCLHRGPRSHLPYFAESPQKLQARAFTVFLNGSYRGRYCFRPVKKSSVTVTMTEDRSSFQAPLPLPDTALFRHRPSFSFTGRRVNVVGHGVPRRLHPTASALEVALFHALVSTWTVDLLIVSPRLRGSNPYPCGSLTYRNDLFYSLSLRAYSLSLMSLQSLFESLQSLFNEPTVSL